MPWEVGDRIKTSPVSEHCEHSCNANTNTESVQESAGNDIENYRYTKQSIFRGRVLVEQERSKALSNSAASDMRGTTRLALKPRSSKIVRISRRIIQSRLLGGQQIKLLEGKKWDCYVVHLANLHLRSLRQPGKNSP